MLLGILLTLGAGYLTINSSVMRWLLVLPRTGYSLYLGTVVTGIIVTFCVIAALLVLEHGNVSTLSPKYLTEFVDGPMLATASMWAFFLASGFRVVLFIVLWVWKKTFPSGYHAFDAECYKGHGMHKLVCEIAHAENLLLVTLQTGKFYIGRPVFEPSDDTWLRISPVVSGYRDAEFQLSFNMDYRAVYGDPVAQIIHIPVASIASTQPFEFSVHNQFTQQQPPKHTSKKKPKKRGE